MSDLSVESVEIYTAVAAAFAAEDERAAAQRSAGIQTPAAVPAAIAADIRIAITEAVAVAVPFAVAIVFAAHDERAAAFDKWLSAEIASLKTELESLKRLVHSSITPLKPIFRNHLAKGAASRIFWETSYPTLAQSLCTPEDVSELTILFNSLDKNLSHEDRIHRAVGIYRRHRCRDMETPSDRNAYKKAFPLPQTVQPAGKYDFLSSSKLKTSGLINEEDRKWLEQNISDIIASPRNGVARKVTATHLATFLELEEQASSPEYDRYAAFYLIVFGFSHKDINNQPPAVLEHAVLTNCECYLIQAISQSLR
ncbi:hypothetical protein BDP27DRAFT_1430200 [Rhodocollybia butyracea]|uniref:Uncharacterized protein n=1 Tax=Rhodocollybia butyracea TaxID=206335 RepID=A0A9P5PBD3_9AGAR|nr:hypothetical protein BDP27DRAFT_1430200 [Rhodocollybia butyracea]